MIMAIYNALVTKCSCGVIYNGKMLKDIQLFEWLGYWWFKFYSVYSPIVYKFSKINTRERDGKQHICAWYWDTT